jgi:hypothetical protein
MGKAEAPSVVVNNDDDATFISFLFISFTFRSATLLLLTLFLHRDYLEDVLSSLYNASKSEEEYPLLLKWVIMRRRWHNQRMCNRLSLLM